MRNEVVIVRQYDGSPLVRRVWDMAGETVYICDDAMYERLEAGDSTAMPVGFPREDVFKPVDGAAAPWDQMELWEG